jgi:hypothetical protein
MIVVTPPRRDRNDTCVITGNYLRIQNECLKPATGKPARTPMQKASRDGPRLGFTRMVY